MEVLEQARILGKTLRESEEFTKYYEAEAAFKTDETALALIEEYTVNQEKYVEKLQAEDITPDEMVNVKKQMSDDYAKLLENDVIRAYTETKEEAESLLARVNQIIKFYIVGEEDHEHEGGCSGHCHTCGGCH
ncbi:MAG: YlbF family regulator [Clostridia bacterium]|nr:YlbF family regulator [Clostridia bacterium]